VKPVEEAPMKEMAMPHPGLLVLMQTLLLPPSVKRVIPLLGLLGISTPASLHDSSGQQDLNMQ